MQQPNVIARTEIYPPIKIVSHIVSRLRARVSISIDQVVVIFIRDKGKSRNLSYEYTTHA